MFIALMVSGFACADPIPKPPPEPEWMANFRYAYQLKEGQYVKRVPSPFVRERIDFMVGAFAPPKVPEFDKKLRNYYLQNANRFTLIFDQSGTKLHKRMALFSNGRSNNPNEKHDDNLFEVSYAVELITGLSSSEFVVDPRFDKDLLFDRENLTVNGDFVVRKNAPVEKLAKQLEVILQKECKVPCQLRVDMMEQEVYVAQGKFELNPPKWRAESKNPRLKNLIDVFATKEALDPGYDQLNLEQASPSPVKALSSQYSGSPIDLVRFLGERVRQRIVWDMDIPSDREITWCNHLSLNSSPQLKSIDVDPAKVLKNMESQTGLTFKKEKRKVPVLVIFPSELK